MKHAYRLFFLLFATCMFSLSVSAARKSQPKPIVPKAVWYDTDGNVLNAHGAGVLYHEGKYYLYGEYKTSETSLLAHLGWECYRTDVSGVSCYSSTNLTDWTFEGVALSPVSDDESHDLHPSKVCERPKVIYNAKTKKFVMWTHAESADYSKACAGVAVSDSPTGPFEYLGSFRPNGAMSRDQTLFVDDDGTAYQLCSSENNATLYINRLTPDYLKPDGTFVRRFIGQSREAPAVFKYNGKYYLLSSGCTGWDPNQAELAVADDIMGEWTVLGNPCTGVDADKTFYGQSTFVIPVDRDHGKFIACFDMWNKTNLKDSRYIWLPISFEGGKVTIPWRDSWTMDELMEGKIFEVTNPDKSLSPYTGMTRDHWKQAAEYLLATAFAYVDDVKDPFDLPKQFGKGYPRNADGIPTSRMEALCRTMFLAGPLLKENPDLTLNGVKVGDYYRYQIASFLDKDSPIYLPEKRWRGNGGQKLVELGGLAVSLLMAPDVFWEPLPKDTRDRLAAVFKTYAEGETIGMNWRFFNQCLLSFLHREGYQVNTKYLEELLHDNLDAYVGEGWYHDSPLFDYYSMWAFQMYGPLWAESYGKKYYPTEAGQFMKNLSDITIQYPYMFGRDGKMQMWGRSITYRMGAAIPLALTGLLHSDDIDYGWMRRICSGAILQFLQHPEFIAEDGLPNLGFYDHFEDCLQTYSCRGSVFWMAKLFLALYMPADNPFWTARETEGAWAKMKKNTPYNVYSDKAKTLTTDYPTLGMAEFRNVFTRNNGFYYGLENYNRLAYNSALPWQSDGPNGEVAMSYVVEGKDGKWLKVNSYKGEGLDANGVFRRTAEMEGDKSVSISLSEKITPDGMTRSDVVVTDAPRKVRMGFYALPELDQPIKVTMKKVDGKKAVTIDNGKFAVTTVLTYGWDDIEVVHCKDLHPEATRSVVVNLTTTVDGAKTLKSQLIMKKSK